MPLRLALQLHLHGPHLLSVLGMAVRNAGREARRCHGGGPTRGGAVSDVPLIKAAKLWAKVSQRTGATYLTGRWGGGRGLGFENLERTSGGRGRATSSSWARAAGGPAPTKRPRPGGRR